MKFQKIAAASLAAVMLAAGLAGCSGKPTGSNDGKINVSIGNWPDETQPERVAEYDGLLSQMKELYPNINITPDTYKFDTKTFTMKASAKQLPTAYFVPFTDINQIIKAGYAADVTEIMKKNGMMDAINPDILSLITDGSGKIYAFPTEAYAQGLTINKALFKEAGLVNEDGSIKIPDTYQEMAEFSKIIKEKTGRAGYCIPTTNNCGGWHFMNIAWSYGAEFMKQNEDGSWTATFNSPEAVAALQYVKDLKWKYDVVPDATVIDQSEMNKLFGTGQAAMIFSPPSNDFSKKYGMNVSDIMLARMPAGEHGRYSQMGGTVIMFTADASEDEVDACFKWFELNGMGLQMDDRIIANKEKSMKNTVDQNGLVLDRTAFPLWVNEERVAKEMEIASKYTNVDSKDFASYYEFKDVTVKPEEPIACQQLYAVLDGCIQEVLTNQNADPAALLENACKDFQANHLDKAE